MSVLIAARNAARFLGEAIESVLAQTFKDFELVIVDDGSTDNTAAVAQGYAARDRRIRVFAREHRGIAAATNFGLAMCRADLVARLDADDTSMPERLEKQVAFMAHNPRVAVLGAAFINVWSDREAVARGPTTPEAMREDLARRCSLGHSTAIMRRQLILDLGGYREAFRAALDYDLWLRVSHHADIVNLPDVLGRYRHHPTQLSVVLAQPQAAYVELARIAWRRRQAGKPDPFAGVAFVDASNIDRFWVLFLKRRRLKALLAGRWRPPPPALTAARKALGRFARAIGVDGEFLTRVRDMF